MNEQKSRLLTKSKQAKIEKALGNLGIIFIFIYFIFYIYIYIYQLTRAYLYARLLWLLSAYAIHDVEILADFLDVMKCWGFVHFQKKSLQQSVTIKKAFNYKGLSQKTCAFFGEFNFGHYILATYLQSSYNNVYIKYIDLLKYI